MNSDSVTQGNEASPIMHVKWCGFRYGQCVMWPGKLRSSLILGDTYKDLGKPELIADKIHKYRTLKEKYGEYRFLKDGPPDELCSFVFDSHAEAVRIFGRKELDLLETGEGLDDALAYLQSRRIELEVLSETKKSMGPGSVDVVVKFLKSRELDKYFRKLITPQGKIDLEDNSVDLRYNGRLMRDGTLYDTLAKDLSEKDVEPQEAVLVGAFPDTDIDPAHSRGFKTIQYKGFADLGDSKADTAISSFRELKEILRKKG
ncbi:MAG: hypothetical protein V1792_10420 [Pseudomonadota bacterium]